MTSTLMQKEPWDEVKWREIDEWTTKQHLIIFFYNDFADKICNSCACFLSIHVYRWVYAAACCLISKFVYGISESQQKNS